MDKKVSKSKMDFFKNGYLSKINQGSRPTRVSTGIFALYIVSASNP